MQYARDKSELFDLLDQHLGFLRRSSQAYDDGAEDEAIRLAVGLRVLLHDTSRSKSLLGQLGLKDQISFVDTALPPAPPGVIRLQSGLVMKRATLGGPSANTRYVAPLDNLPPERLGKRVPFEPWWTESVVDDREGRPVTRGELVRDIANKEGAHVDPSIDGVYAALTKENSLGWTVPDDDGVDRPLDGNVGHATVRQVTYEFLESVSDELVSRAREVA